MKTIDELMRIIERYKTGDVTEANLRAQLELHDALVAEQCAQCVREANAWRGGHGQPPMLSMRELADLLTTTFPKPKG